jgi:galactokinase
MQQTFTQQFQTQPQVLSVSPGRINLIGEHTDYNDGFVLPGAIDKKVTFLLAKNGLADTCHVHSMDMKQSIEFSLKDLKPHSAGGWQNYIIGVAAELQEKGAKLQGFDATFEGDIPLGAGLSSSAALECSLATGLNTLFDLGFSQIELIKIAQMAEHHYAGVKCGIMDQFASVMGKKDQVFRLDCRTLVYDHFPLDLKDYQLLLLDTCVEHSLGDSAYNERRNQCEAGVKLLKKIYPETLNLRDINPGQLIQHKDIMSETVYHRCLHVVNENERVNLTCQALTDHDMPLLGSLLYQSHDSLSNLYEVSCEELDFLVDYTRPLDYVLGGRMMGGGFGGCTINLILSSEKDAFIAAISAAYKAAYGIQLKAYAVSLEDGASAKRLTL